jgi:hypothetical protein
MKEFKVGQVVEAFWNSNWNKYLYVGTYRTQHIIGSVTGDVIKRVYDDCIREVVEVKKPSFIDLVIDWSGDRPTFDKIEICDIGIAVLYELEDWQVGVPYKGWVLSGYVFDADVAVQDRALRFINGHRREVSNRATHGRFVKI